MCVLHARQVDMTFNNLKELFTMLRCVQLHCPNLINLLQTDD
jgi:hypothetical protein